MGNPQSDLDFRLMSLNLQLRDLFSLPKSVLKEVEIRPGYRVLDYGCGPGSYIEPVAELVGSSGEIYALDIHPLAIKMVQERASKRGLLNVKTIHSDCATGLPDNSVDVVLLYDTFHGLSRPERVLQELHRILKPEGTLSFSDHHMKEGEILSKVTSGNLFRFVSKGQKTYTFVRQG